MTKVQEPAITSPTEADWQTELTIRGREAKDFICIQCDNINTTGPAILKLGSSCMVNGALYETPADETPQAGSLTNNELNYLYAEPSGALSANLVYRRASTTPATWSAAKGGWYNGNNRALLKFLYVDGQYYGKVILDSYNAMSIFNADSPIPTTGGTLVALGSINTASEYIAEPGIYRYELKGGTGGRGGKASTDNEYLGGLGAEGEVVTGSFVLDRKTIVMLTIGGDGGDGGNGMGNSGDNDTNSAGGGGATGGGSVLQAGEFYAIAIGGSGGGGAGSNGNNDNGAGRRRRRLWRR